MADAFGFVGELLARRRRRAEQANQDPLTTMLEQEDIYRLPVNVKRGLARVGGENRAELTSAQVGTMGSFKRFMLGAGPSTHANTELSGAIGINPESALVGSIPYSGQDEDIADAMVHELAHRRQVNRLSKPRVAIERAKENLFYTYPEGPLEQEAFKAQAERASRRGYHSPYVPVTIMSEALAKRKAQR